MAWMINQVKTVFIISGWNFYISSSKDLIFFQRYFSIFFVFIFKIISIVYMVVTSSGLQLVWHAHLKEINTRNSFAYIFICWKGKINFFLDGKIEWKKENYCKKKEKKKVLPWRCCDPFEENFPLSSILTAFNLEHFLLPSVFISCIYIFAFSFMIIFTCVFFIDIL